MRTSFIGCAAGALLIGALATPLRAQAPADGAPERAPTYAADSTMQVSARSASSGPSAVAPFTPFVPSAPFVGSAPFAPRRSATAPQPEHELLEVGGYVSTRLEAPRASAPTRFVLRRAVGEVELSRGRFGLETELELENETPSGFLDERKEEEHELELEQATLSYAAAAALALRAGLLLPPVGRLNARNEDWLWDLPQRPLIDRAVPVLPARAAWKAPGVGAVLVRPVERGGSGRARGRLRAELYLLRATEQELKVIDPAGAAAPARALVRASDDLEPEGGFPLALAGRLGLLSGDGSELALSAHAGRWARDGAGRSAGSWTLGLDGVHRLGALVVEGEALYGRYARTESVLAGFARAAADSLRSGGGGGPVPVDLQGLARARYGLWLDVKRPIALRPLVGHAPALLTPLVRYEQVRLGGAITGFTLTGDDVAGLTRGGRAQERISAGVAFRPLPNVVLHAVGQRSRSLGGPLLEPATLARSLEGLYVGLAIGLGD